ncbi:hypothetical protein HK407_09g13710 [Ordospora pajunii]|uniref:uncharacterized protein n=1 Tax=Ordospora pajunii TaxID=3039483 RepID=UPI0029527939|nr:uncharacterized protein HK407_09g13710 [Ordospora pajunii]KAH9410958.1 hypothetical protein HK407_09g13710 [Ordospora pajunii]
MKFNKRCLTAFSDESPFMAMGTKSKLFDTSFSLTSELFLYDYSLGVQYPSLQTDNKFYRLKWCEGKGHSVLATGNEEGKVTLYAAVPEKEASFEMLSSCNVLEGSVLGLDFNLSKEVLAAGSSNGKIIFWNLNKLDSQYTSDISISSNITCLAWNKKVSRILCAGTDDGKILILDIRAKNVAMTLGGEGISMVNDVMWHPSGSTSVIAATDKKALQCFNLSSDSMSEIGEHENGMIGLSTIDELHIAAASKEKISIIEMSENRVVDTIDVDGVIEMSFSRKDPLMAFSYASGTTEIVPRVSMNVISRYSSCIIGDKVIAKEKYVIEDECLEEVEEDELHMKVKELLYKDGKYELNREELGELLLEECMRTNKECSEDEEDLNKGIEGLKLDAKLDLCDPLTLSLIRGDMEEAYENAIKSKKKVSLSLLLALAKDKDEFPECLDGFDDMLILLSVTQISSVFSKLLEKISADQWMVFLATISFSLLSDEEFVKNALKMAEKLEDRQKLCVYAITNDLEKYFELKSSMYKKPTSVYEVREFFQEYKGLVCDLELMGGAYKDQIINEYFWYGMAHGEKPPAIKYEDVGINTYLGNLKSHGVVDRNVPESEDIYDVKEMHKPAIPKQEQQKIEEPLKGIASPKHANTGMYGMPLKLGEKDFHAQHDAKRGSVNTEVSTSKVNKIMPPMPAIGSIPQRPPVSSTPSLGKVGKSPTLQMPQSRTSIPRPGYGTSGSSGYANTSEEIMSKLYASIMNSSSEHLNKSPSMPVYGSMSQGVRSPIIGKGTPPKMGIPKPGMISSPMMSNRESFLKPGETSMKGMGGSVLRSPSPQMGQQNVNDAAKEADLDSEKILTEFESLIAGLTEKASEKANLIIKSKLKDISKKFALYKSVPRNTFGAKVLRGLNGINMEMKKNASTEEMKQNVQKIVCECAESGENMAEIWMPCVYTLLQIVYH